MVVVPACRSRAGNIGTSGGSGTSLRMCMPPVVWGSTAVMIAVRDGAHTGAAAQARVNRAPRLASASSVGVLASGSP